MVQSVAVFKHDCFLPSLLSVLSCQAAACDADGLSTALPAAAGVFATIPTAESLWHSPINVNPCQQQDDVPSALYFVQVFRVDQVITMNSPLITAFLSACKSEDKIGVTLTSHLPKELLQLVSSATRP